MSGSSELKVHIKPWHWTLRSVKDTKTDQYIHIRFRYILHEGYKHCIKNEPSAETAGRRGGLSELCLWLVRWEKVPLWIMYLSGCKQRWQLVFSEAWFTFCAPTKKSRIIYWKRNVN